MSQTFFTRSATLVFLVGLVQTNESLVENVVGVVYFGVGDKNPKLFLDDYDYLLLKKYPDRTTWMCTAYYGRIKDKQHRCKSRIVTSGRIAYVTGVHNHEPRVKNRNKYRNMLSDIVTVIRQ
jgi:hypothetical protein